MDITVNIKPFDQVKTTKVTSMSVRVMRFELFKGASIHVSLMDENGNAVDSKMVEINGDDYKKWGGDDTFIYEYIANKLGFSMPDVVDSAPAPTPPPVIPMQEPVPTPVEEPVPTSE